MSPTSPHTSTGSSRRNLGINASVLADQSDRSALTSILDEAEAQGLIDAQATDELDKADLVLTADYLLAETSITIQQDGIDRAGQRAPLLDQATVRTVTPFAVGAWEQPDLRRGDVQIILIPERQTF